MTESSRHWSPVTTTTGSVTIGLDGAQAIQQAQAVDEGHPQVENHGVGIPRLDLAKPGFGVRGNPNFVALEHQNFRECLPRRIIVVDDKQAAG